jgi:hypothetical protein
MIESPRWLQNSLIEKNVRAKCENKFCTTLHLRHKLPLVENPLPSSNSVVQDLHTNSIKKKSRATPHSAESWSSAMPHSAGPHIFVYISANSQQNSKIFYSMNQGPRWDCLMKITRGQKSRVTLEFYFKFAEIFACKFLSHAMPHSAGSKTFQ